MIEAAAEFEKTLQLDKDHNGALFELAYINDLYGNDDLALEYYKRCTDRPPVPLAAWVNLGILYEDEMRFREAEQCYRHVLAHEPNHPRARLFVKDCQASKGMYYDEEAERGYTVLKQLHEIPVTDFELSVRSRNCLRKMNIRTLGDLTRTTEAALLSSKNFGETSLAEIKDMMHAKGLRLGMSLEGSERGPHDHRIEQPQEVPPELQAILNKPIGDLNLSVRARKCMSKLNIQTVGDILKHTGDELLECKNFGVTSLNEVRDKLHGPQLETQKRLIGRRARRAADRRMRSRSPPGRAGFRPAVMPMVLCDPSSTVPLSRRPVRFTTLVQDSRSAARSGLAGDAARVRADAGVHAGRHAGDGQGSDTRADRRDRHADAAGKHVPSRACGRAKTKWPLWVACIRSWAGTGRSSPTRVAFRSSASPTGAG